MDPGSWNQCCSRVNGTQEVLRPDEVREFGFNVKFQLAVEVPGIRMQKQSPEVITEMENRFSGKRPSHGGKRVRRDLSTALGQSCRKWAKITSQLTWRGRRDYGGWCLPRKAVCGPWGKLIFALLWLSLAEKSVFWLKADKSRLAVGEAIWNCQYQTNIF